MLVLCRKTLQITKELNYNLMYGHDYIGIVSLNGTCKIIITLFLNQFRPDDNILPKI